MLALVCLPFVATLTALGVGIDQALKRGLGIDVWRILFDEAAFVAFANAIAPAIYALLVFFLLARFAETVIRGGGSMAIRVRWLLQGPLAIVRALFVRLLLPSIVALPVVVYLYTIDRYFVRVMGKPD